MPNRLFVALAIILIAFPAASGAWAREKMTVLLDWFVNPDHAALIVAKQGGFFAAEGLDVDLIAPADPNDPPKLVAAGKADIAVSYQGKLHFMADQGLPVVRIGALIDQPLNSLVVLKDGPIRSIADLKGRKVGFSVGGLEEALLRVMLAEAGLGLGDVEPVNVNFSLSSALIAGQVDAVIGAYQNIELNQMDMAGHPGRAFLVAEHGVPACDELILLTHKAAADDPRLPRFLKALKDATVFARNNPDRAWKLFAAAYPDLDDALNRRAWRDTIPLLADDPARLDRARYKAFAGFMKANGLISDTPPLDAYTAEIETGGPS